MVNTNEQVRIRIREYRQRAGLTQESLALKAGIHVSFLSEIERGLKNPSIDTLEKILTALNVSFMDFFDFEVDVKNLKDSPALERLINELNNRTEQDIELIYGLAKLIFTFNEKQ